MNESGENNVCCVVIQLRTSDTSTVSYSEQTKGLKYLI